MSLEQSRGCETKLIDPNMLSQPISKIEGLPAEEREALEVYLAERCMGCVEVCTAEDDVTALSERLADNSNCFVSVMRAAFIAADRVPDPFYEEALMYGNHFDPPEIEGLS